MTKPWADTPFALLPIPGTPNAPSSPNPSIQSVCIDMANIHNILLRALNSIYLQSNSPSISHPADIADLMLYITAWADTVHHHHSLEETIFFPRVEALAREAGLEDGVMSRNVEQHYVFEPGIKAVRGYARDVLAGKKEFDGGGLRVLIEGFAEALTRHLHDEIETLIKLDKCDGEKVLEALKEVGEVGQKTADPYMVIPLVLGCIDKGYPGSAHFPPLPFFMPWLNAYWFTRKHKGCWRFNPCDHWGKPRPLQFL